MFYVIDEDNNTSWSHKLQCSENFKTRKSAEKRAKELVKSEPGKRFAIVKTVATVECDVGDPIIEEWFDR